MNAVILDGEQRSALAATRSLGRRGIKVIVGAEKIPSLSSCSRYCGASFTYPSPYDDPDGFLRALKNLSRASRDSILFPMTDVTLTEILSNRMELPESVLLPFVDYEKYLQVTDKIHLYRLGMEMNVPLPATLISTDFDDRENLMEAVRKFGFPVVVKPAFSKIRTGKGWIDAKVYHVREETNLRNVFSYDIFRHYPFLVQKRIEGPGVGIFLLMKDGKVLARFAHRRIREKPPSGGVSVLCESIEPPADAIQAAVKILSELHWTGVAMVEFKIDREQNVAKLLEVNARFWGSLQLAISSGVDFPYLLFKLANGEKFEEPDSYTVGLRSRWELGDLDHLLLCLFKSPSKLNLLPNHPARGTLMKDFAFDFFRPSVRHEIWQDHDIRPFFHEMKGYVKHLFDR
jgi:predicted ATP-grasp superfamily ATP-dependent carboligase